MTADRRAALVEKMISTFNGNYHNGLTNALSAALDLALEEAAKICREKQRYQKDAQSCAAAIQALKGEA